DPARLDARAVHRVDAAAQVDDLRGQQPLRRGLRQRRSGKDPEAPLAGATVIATLFLARDVGGKAGEEGEVEGFVKLGTRRPGPGRRNIDLTPLSQQQL